MYNPKVSIVIPAYNASNYLAEAIDSALSQTYSNVEIIVVNDGSKDKGATREVALSYGNKIRYFEKENGGSSSALNVGISNMTGEWFSWLSHDDLYAPEKLNRQIELIRSLDIDDKEPSRHIFFSASELIDAKGKVFRACNIKQKQKLASQISLLPHNGCLIAEPSKYLFHGCSCLIHKDALKEVGGFDENLKLLNDADLWFRLYSSDYKVHYIPEPLVKGRVHSAQVSKSIGYSYHNPEQDMYWNRSLDWLINHHPAKKDLFYSFGKNAYLKTRSHEGDRAFRHIASITPKHKFGLSFLGTSFKIYAKLYDCAKKIYLHLKS